MPDGRRAGLPEDREADAARRAALLDIAVVLGLFLAAGVAAGVLWPHLVSPVEVVRNDFGIATDEVALANRISHDGWYAALAVAGGLVVGVVSAAWRRTHEVVTVLAVVAGSLLAALVAARLGTALGPPDPQEVLASAEVGASAPGRVQVHATGDYLVWPIAALLGTSVVLLRTAHDPRAGAGRPSAEVSPGEVSPAGEPAPPPRTSKP